MLELPLTESDTLELKREWSGKLKGLEDLAAFANTNGGTLVIGVDDDGVTVPGFTPNDAALRVILNEITDGLHLTPRVLREPTSAGPVVLTVSVQPAATLVAHQGRYYKRVGSANRQMTAEELAGRAVEVSGQSWDALPHGEAFDLADHHPRLSPEALQAFLALAGPRLPHANPAAPQRDTLEKLNLTRGGRPTRAALLLFGRRPQDIATGTGVQLAQFRGGALVQDRTHSGPLQQQLEAAMDDLRFFQLSGERIGETLPVQGGGTLELFQRAESWTFPLAALREAVVNALIHRDYTGADRIQIRVSEDALSIWNPGGLPAGLSVADLGRPEHPSRRRNPLLADAFYTLGLVERWGTGTTRMIQAMRDAGLPDPVFEESGGGFRVTLRADPITPERLAGLNSRQRGAIDFLRQFPTLTNADYRGLFETTERTASLDLQQLLNLGLVVREGRGRGVRYRLNLGQNPQ